MFIVFVQNAQNWIQYLLCGLINSEKGGRISSLDLLATLSLMQSGCCWSSLLQRHIAIMLNLLVTRIPRYISTKLLSSCPASCALWSMVPLPGPGLCISFSGISRGSCLPVPLVNQHPCEQHQNHLVQQPLLSLLHHWQTH